VFFVKITAHILKQLGLACLVKKQNTLSSTLYFCLMPTNYLPLETLSHDLMMVALILRALNLYLGSGFLFLTWQHWGMIAALVLFYLFLIGGFLQTKKGLGIQIPQQMGTQSSRWLNLLCKLSTKN
jgi:hypothetical protein